jgi:hypothetical protein
MSLKLFHAVFITVSTALTLLCAGLSLRAVQAGAGGGARAGLGLSLAAAVALSAYGAWFYRKMARLP